MSRAHHHRKLTVLVVDDAVAVSTTLMWLLRQNGYECAAVGTRREALQLCAGMSPDLALIEMSLPDASGVETARDLRSRVPGCRMLLMSGDPDAGDYVHRARAAGLDCELLPKPIPVEELLQKVQDVLAQPA
jgi:two-component system, NarL family, response regulator DesR